MGANVQVRHLVLTQVVLDRHHDCNECSFDQSNAAE